MVQVEPKNVWSNLLKETNEKYTCNLPLNKSLIVIGDNSSGKSTLFSRLAGIEDAPESRGIEYHLLNIKDEMTDDEAILGCYVLDGDDGFTSLMRNFLTAKNFKDFSIVVVLNMNEPWKLVDSFKKWMDLIEKFINEIDIPQETMNKFKANIVQKFKNYVEYEDQVTNIVSQSVKESTLPKIPSTTAAILGRLPVQNTMKNTEEDDEETETVLEIPLTEGALVKNLGIQIEVVVTKTDCMSTLEEELKLNDEHFDFIQMHLRRLCLYYGAGLIYTSVKGDKNCQLLKGYLKHQIYGFPLQQIAYVIEKDSVFVPAGWDSEKRINTLQQNLIQLRSNESYESVINRPKSKKNKPEIEVEIEDEQIFLAKVYSSLSKDNVYSSAHYNTLKDEDSSAAGKVKSPAQRKAQIASSRDYSTSSPNSGNNSLSQASVQGGVSNPATEGVLANFFNSLLKKPASELEVKDKTKTSDSPDTSANNSISERKTVTANETTPESQADVTANNTTPKVEE